VETGPGDIAVLKEIFGHLERRLDVPGDEIHIAAVEAGGSSSESEYLRTVAGGEQFLQLIPEVEDLLGSFFLPQGIQRVAEEARHRAVSMEIVHEVIVGIQVAVDERHTAGGTGHYIQPPVSVGVFIGFHFVAKIALQIGFWIGREFQTPLLQSVGKLGHKNGRLRPGFLQHIKAVYVSHVGNLDATRARASYVLRTTTTRRARARRTYYVRRTEDGLRTYRTTYRTVPYRTVPYGRRTVLPTVPVRYRTVPYGTHLPTVPLTAGRTTVR